MRPVCVACECEMKCTLTGALIRINPNYFYAGDMFECPICENSIITGMSNGQHVEDPSCVLFEVDFYKEGK